MPRTVGFLSSLEQRTDVVHGRTCCIEMMGQFMYDRLFDAWRGSGYAHRNDAVDVGRPIIEFPVRLHREPGQAATLPGKTLVGNRERSVDDRHEVIGTFDRCGRRRAGRNRQKAADPQKTEQAQAPRPSRVGPRTMHGFGRRPHAADNTVLMATEMIEGDRR